MAAGVVCGVDDYTGARKAARVADELARNLGARLVLVHAGPVAPPIIYGVQSIIYGVPFDNDALQREVMQDATRLLEDLASTCASEQISQRAELGSPIEVLVRALEEEGADLLGVGTRGRGAMRSGGDALGAIGQRRSRDARSLSLPRRCRSASYCELISGPAEIR